MVSVGDGLSLLSDCLFFLFDLFRFMSSVKWNGMEGVGKRYMFFILTLF